MAISQATQFALVKQKLDAVSDKLSSLENSLETKYAQQTELALVRIAIAALEVKMVTKEQFWPVRVLVFGAAGFMLLGLLGFAGTVLTRIPPL